MLPGIDLERWFHDLRHRDPRLHEELSRRRLTRRQGTAEAVTLESAAELPAKGAAADLSLETIVREGRPALSIKQDRIDGQDAVVEAAARVVVERLLAAAAAIEPQLPRVGRIEVADRPGEASGVGTGWLVDRDVVITNRHVAERIARPEGRGFHFLPGRFGDDLTVSLDYRHELGLESRITAPVLRVIWIEPGADSADLALLEVGRRSDGLQPGWIDLAETDAEPGTDVAVIGYPARASAWIIPDQAWMDRIYGGAYDVKRIAPGLMGAPSRGWPPHDCTTLGGNSGSVVVNMSGKAVALHFAGQYMLANYAVPASTVRRCLAERPWTGRVKVLPTAEPPATRIGFAEPPPAGTHRQPPAGMQGPPAALAIETAARQLWLALAGAGVLAVRPGYRIVQGTLSDSEFLVVAVHPERIDAVRAAAPPAHAGFPVEVRPASLRDQLAAAPAEWSEEAVAEIAYDDAGRAGSGYSFDWLDEEMAAVLHVGPERSWTVLSEFLAQARDELVSSMYEFHAAHIAAAVHADLARGAKLRLVLARQSRDPRSGTVAKGDFNRRQTFEEWEEAYHERFERVFVPTGSRGLVATAYHIKVTVRDKRSVWLSSGNWKRTSQPLIAAASLDDPAVTGRAGNREWHVVVESAKLAERLRNHILADYEQSLELGGMPEAVEEEPLVDVPAARLEGIELEGAPTRVVEPLTLRRRLRIKPLLTPDRRGQVYCEAVLDLIRSARRQLVFQNQYINVSGAGGGYLDQLVDALVDTSTRCQDVRIILRSADGFLDDASALKRRGLDVDRCLRRLANTHTKGIVVDGERVLVGSHNWSGLGVTLNRDASLIFDDPEVARYFLAVFELDWQRAAPLGVVPEAASEAPRLAAGDRPPAGFVRMSLAEYMEG